MGDGAGTYEAAASIMALATQDAVQNRGSDRDDRRLHRSAVRTPTARGITATGPAGDTSISQYAVLGLWEAENAGVDVSPSVWDRAASWFMSVQSSAGSWNYHRDEASQPETCA